MLILINSVLLTLLAIITLAIIRQRSLFGVAILAGAYSFLMASVMIVLDAVDVAMTEAAVGAGVSTVFVLAALHLTSTREYPQPRGAMIPLFVTIVTGAALVWGTSTLPPFGIADAPVHQVTAPHYLGAAKEHRIAPNVVTAILGDYRGYDTLGETIVVFTGAMGAVLLLKGKKKQSQPSGSDRDPA